jgi:hypothetical protein
MHSLRIVLFSLGCAVLYGIGHDQVTARVCVEYFTVGHPSLLGLRDPTVLGIVWGIIATWWVGLALGLLLALVCRLGTRPTLTVRDVCWPILVVMLGVGVTSLIAGLAGYTLARTGTLLMPYTLVTRVPVATQAAFLADAWAHQNAYNVGLLGGLAVCLWAWRERGRRTRPARPSRWGPWWRAVQRRVWDHTARSALLPRPPHHSTHRGISRLRPSCRARLRRPARVVGCQELLNPRRTRRASVRYRDQSGFSRFCLHHGSH